MKNNLIININGKEYSTQVINNFRDTHCVTEIHGFQHGWPDSQLYDIDWECDPTDEDWNAASWYERNGYGCCYNCSWESLAEELQLPVEEVLVAYMNGYKASVTKGIVSTETWEEANYPTRLYKRVNDGITPHYEEW